ncbi:MAG TPA: hypothetical protein VFS43_31195 [Polyangiaceae bacterium]|nr:hypothetical protein [Polyangiaceae bacterium]
MPSRRAPLWPPFALAAALALGTTPAYAQATAEEKAAAERLFERALSLMAADQAPEACPLFEEVVRITSGLGAQYELAKCYEKAGRLASAWATYREVSQRDRGKRAKDARTAAERLEPALAHLTVEVPAPTAALPGFEVRRDGRPILREVWGLSIPVDPGEHRVEASAKGKASWSTQINLAQGGSRSVTVGPLVDDPGPAALPPAPPPPAPTPPAPPPPRSTPADDDGGAPRGRTQRIVGLSVAGLGLVGLGAGVFLGFDANSKYEEQRDNGECKKNNVCTPAGDRISKDAIDQGTLGTIVGGAGLAALVGGFVLYLTAPSGKAPAAAKAGPALTWQPSVGRGRAALDLALRW